MNLAEDQVAEDLIELNHTGSGITPCHPSSLIESPLRSWLLTQKHSVMCSDLRTKYSVGVAE